MSRDNLYADAEKQYIGAQLQQASAGIGRSIRSDDPQPFHTLGTVYDHIQSVHKQGMEILGMLSAVAEKMDGSGPVNAAVDRSTRADPRNVVEAFEERISDIEGVLQNMYQYASVLSRRIL